MAQSDFSSQVQESFTRGVAILNREGITPPYFSETMVGSVAKIVQQFSRNGMHAVAFESNESAAPVNLTPEAAPKIARLTGHAYYALGAIEGYVQLVSVNPRARRFSITHSRTLKTVRCSFPENIEEDIFEAIRTRRKIIVSGRISYNAKHEPLSIFLSKGIRFIKAK